MSRLNNFKKRMDKDTTFAKSYCAAVEDLIRKGYAQRLPEEPGRPRRTWYLPHFAVFNSNKPGKLRIVFDAAAKAHGLCLNDKFFSGPVLTCSLLGVLMRFRQRTVAIKADIKEMFLRVKIREENQDVQRVSYGAAWIRFDLQRFIV